MEGLVRCSRRNIMQLVGDITVFRVNHLFEASTFGDREMCRRICSRNGRQPHIVCFIATFHGSFLIRVRSPIDTKTHLCEDPLVKSSTASFNEDN